MLLADGLAYNVCVHTATGPHTHTHHEHCTARNASEQQHHQDAVNHSYPSGLRVKQHERLSSPPPPTQHALATAGHGAAMKTASEVKQINDDFGSQVCKFLLKVQVFGARSQQQATWLVCRALAGCRWVPRLPYPTTIRCLTRLKTGSCDSWC